MRFEEKKSTPPKKNQKTIAEIVMDDGEMLKSIATAYNYIHLQNKIALEAQNSPKKKPKPKKTTLSLAIEETSPKNGSRSPKNYHETS